MTVLGALMSVSTLVIVVALAVAADSPWWRLAWTGLAVFTLVGLLLELRALRRRPRT